MQKAMQQYNLGKKYILNQVNWVQKLHSFSASEEGTSPLRHPLSKQPQIMVGHTVNNLSTTGHHKTYFINICTRKPIPTNLEQHLTGAQKIMQGAAVQDLTTPENPGASGGAAPWTPTGAIPSGARCALL